MAIGLAHQATSQYEEARGLYEQSRSVFVALDNQYKLLYGASTESPYRGFCRQLSSLISQIKTVDTRRLPVISFAGQVTAGMPPYLHGEQDQNTAEALVLDESDTNSSA